MMKRKKRMIKNALKSKMKQIKKRKKKKEDHMHALLAGQAKKSYQSKFARFELQTPRKQREIHKEERLEQSRLYDRRFANACSLQQHSQYRCTRHRSS